MPNASAVSSTARAFVWGTTPLSSKPLQQTSNKDGTCDAHVVALLIHRGVDPRSGFGDVDTDIAEIGWERRDSIAPLAQP